jgi:lantibiotic modifying enzyme
VKAALLRAGQVLPDPKFLDMASRLSIMLADDLCPSPDVFNGLAGRLRFHLLVWHATGDDAHLAYAVDAGDLLLQSARTPAPGYACWTIPPGYGELSNQTLAGYAHGAAGIGDCLVDLYEATGAPRFAAVARHAAQWVAAMRFSEAPAETGSGSDAMIDALAGNWCHGAAGIRRFMLRLAQSGVWLDARPLAERAAVSVARVTRRHSPTQCHGLAGSIEFLLDVYQATGDLRHLGEARSLELLMSSYRLDRKDGLTWSCDHRRSSTPDYMVGYAGIATCLLRLAAPSRLPHQLSMKGFSVSQSLRRLAGPVPPEPPAAEKHDSCRAPGPTGAIESPRGCRGTHIGDE